VATQTTLLAGLAPELRTWYDNNLLARLLPRLVYLNFGQVRPMPAHAGQTVQFRRFESLGLATAALTEGVTPGSETPTISVMTATPVQHGSWIEVSDVLDFTAPDPVLTEFTTLLGEQAAQSIDILTRDILVAGTNVQYSGTNVARNTIVAADKLTSVEIRKAVRTMQTNKIASVTNILNASTGVGTKPINAGYIGIIGPSALYDLKSDPKWVPVSEYGSSVGGTLPYEVGALDDVRFILSNNSKVYTGGGAGGTVDVGVALILGGDSFGIISPMGIENIIKGFGVTGLDPLNQRATTGWKCFFTAVILNQLGVIRIEHGFSA
jgi:N4-gp56 family major capsid protein